MRHLLVIASVLGAWHHAASACPATVPVPATDTDVACYTLERPVDQRCAAPINPTVCGFLNNTAFNEGLVTQAGFNYLGTHGFCAMVNNFGAGDVIYDFCPQGCFAADTQVLTGLALDGRQSYAAASSVRPHGHLMTLTDDASVANVLLAPQQVLRTVFGPESSPLFVFTLSNGETLRVTEHHPMVLTTGKVVEAGKVDTRSAFVGLDGAPVTITAITREKAVADVFNFETAGTTQLGHILVAEGVLVGDLKLQNELANEDAAIGLRR